MAGAGTEELEMEATWLSLKELSDSWERHWGQLHPHHWVFREQTSWGSRTGFWRKGCWAGFWRINELSSATPEEGGRGDGASGQCDKGMAGAQAEQAPGLSPEAAAQMIPVSVRQGYR